VKREITPVERLTYPQWFSHEENPSVGEANSFLTSVFDQKDVTLERRWLI